MKLPNWFKITWWALITATLTGFLAHRYPDLVAARSTASDVIVFIVWMALLLMPLFTEFEFLGFKFKQEVEKLRNDIKADIQQVRADVRNAVEVNPTFSPQINFPPAPSPDSSLPDLEERVRAAVAKELVERGVHPPSPGIRVETPPPVVMELFAFRYRLDQELNFLAFAKIGLPGRRVTGWQLARALAEWNVIDKEVQEAVREVYAITSAAVHGEKPSDAQISFVRDVAPTLIQSLRAIGRDMD